MFSRAAKSLIKTISQRKYHAGDENVKVLKIFSRDKFLYIRSFWVALIAEQQCCALLMKVVYTYFSVQLAMIGGAGEIGRSLSQMLKQTSKLDVLALYDVTALNKRFSTPTRLQNFRDREAINTGVRMNILSFCLSSRGQFNGFLMIEIELADVANF